MGHCRRQKPASVTVCRAKGSTESLEEIVEPDSLSNGASHEAIDLPLDAALPEVPAE